MEKLRTLFQFLFFVLLFCPFSSVLSRSLEHIPKISVFDVSASIQKTVEILSFNPETLQQMEESKESNSSSTLKLYSRDTLHSSPFTNYRDLIMSRLERDSIRVKFLYKKLNSAFEGNSTSYIKPMGLEAPLTSGMNEGSGEYFTRFGFGTPPKQLLMAIDTGSDVTWIQCTQCSDCYKQKDPIFDPSKSSSYKALSCDSQACKELDVSSCTANTCVYGVAYGDGSTTIGDFVTETLMFGNSAINNIAIGCGHDNEGLFLGAAGLLGLGGGSLSFPSQLKTPAFSYCLVDKDSTSASTIAFGSSATSTDPVTAPLFRNNRVDTFYYVGLTGISVSGQMLHIEPSKFALGSNGDGGVIIDSGTSVTRFTVEVYNALRDAFVSGTKGLPSAGGFSLFDTCYDLTSKTSVHVPTVAFHFGPKSLSLPPKNYLLPVVNKIFCFAFAPTSGPSIIGNIQQQGIRVSFDVGRSLIGFSPSKC